MKNHSHYRKFPGTCLHPACKSRVMTGTDQSAIRCATHAKLCARCWERDFNPETGYCGRCWGAMLRNVGKFHAVVPDVPKRGGNGDDLLRVLDEFKPLWEIDR